MNPRHLFLSALVLLLFSELHSQDSHYWTQQFGTRSALLSGAVLGGANDNTMIYYNPAALAFMQNASISINANAYGIENIRVENALGRTADFESAKIGSIPLLAGGMLRTGNEKWKLGYAFISPVNLNFKGIARAEGNFDLLEDPQSEGLEETVSEASVTNRTSELVFAMGIGHQLNDYWAVGLSNLFTVRSLSFQRSLSTYIFQNDPERTLVGGNLLQNADYYNVRYAAKLGVVFQKGNWQSGLTLTTPSLNLFGQGTVASNIAIRNLRIIDDTPRSGVATARQAEVKTTFKSPLSVALGTNYTRGRSHIGIAVQYFAGQDIYDVMEPAPGNFVRPAELAPQLQSDEFLSLKAGAKSVINIALGYEYQLDENLSLLFGARSDNSFFDKDLNDGPGIKPTISSWDIYHFSGGITLDRENSSLSLGLLYSTGSKGDYEQPGTFDPDNPDLVVGSTTITSAKYSNVGILLGYTFYFKKFQLRDQPGAIVPVRLSSCSLLFPPGV